MNPVHVNDRSRNHLLSTFTRRPDGRWQEHKHPFQCDDCKQESATYGVGGALRCVTCHLKERV